MLVVGCCAMWLPVPQLSSPQKDRSEPYPCMDRPCGCVSAAQCWKQCCCFTNQQKVAWAEENRVTVPESVVAAAAQENAQETAATTRLSCAHCVTVTVRKLPRLFGRHFVNAVVANSSREATATATATATETIDSISHGENVCSSACSDSEQPSLVQNMAVDERPNSDKTPATYFCGIAALECHGLTSLWQILSLTMLPDKACPEVMGQDLMSQVPAFDLVVCSCDSLPPEPPPRIGVAGFRAVSA